MSNSATFRNYIVEKQAVAEALIELKNLAEQTGQADSVQELLVKLAQDKFNLVVVGQFKRGKSSLMNAIIARDLLPTGHLPLTSAITTLCYGPKDRALLKFQGWLLEKEIALSELREYITEEGNPGNARGLLFAQIEINSPFLRRGLHFVDTPGIGSSRHENTRTTYDFLPEADALIFVTSVEGPLSEAEEQFLREIQQYQRKLFVVVNKIDLIDGKELEEVLDYLQREITKVSGANNLRLFPLSARQGIRAKIQKDDVELKHSGIQDFEIALEEFLTEEKEQTFLLSILDRSLQFAQSLNGNTGKPGDSDELHRVTQQIQSLHSRLSEGIPIETTPLPVLNPPDTAPGARDLPKIPTAESPSQDLFSGSSCPVCLMLSKAVFDFFATWQHDFMNAGEIKESFLSRRGFCHFHTWQFQQIASPLGISVGYTPLIELLMADLQRALHTDESPAEALIENSYCPACQYLKEIEERQILAIQNLLRTPEGLSRYTRSRGLCLPHTSLVLRNIEDLSIVRVVLEGQTHRLEELSEDLRSFTLKRSAIQRGLLNSDEQSAWLRALQKIVGDRTVFYHHSAK